jgi:glucose/arabinose dehydrogenase
MRRMALLTLLTLACSGNEPASGQVPQGLVPQEVAGHTLYLPPGFHIGVFADVGGVRNIVLGPGGVAYAARQSAGRVVRVVDVDGDGAADSIVDVATGLNQPFGIAFRGDTMYVGETNEVVRFVPGASAPQVVVPGLPTGGHSTRTVVFGPDGLMYVAVGSSCNVCNESDPRRAAVTRFDPNGSGEHRFATGLRNSVGLAFEPASGALWAVNNDRDNLGDDKPPEHLNILQDGKWYGWPQCYLPGEANPEYPSADCSGVTPPGITFQAHSAPLGLTFYTGTAFPASFRGSAFISYHGSWNRSVPTGAKVVHVNVQNGRPVSVEDFVVGWQLADGSRWGRPVAVLSMPDGSLLISDDAGGKIWRVTYGQ